MVEAYRLLKKSGNTGSKLKILEEQRMRIQPDAMEKVRADSFVMETNIHYPTESSLLLDGLGKIISMSVELAEQYGINGWRQHGHLLNKVKQLARKLHRIAAKKGPNYQSRIKILYGGFWRLSGINLVPNRPLAHDRSQLH